MPDEPRPVPVAVGARDLGNANGGRPVPLHLARWQVESAGEQDGDVQPEADEGEQRENLNGFHLLVLFGGQAALDFGV